MQSTLRHTLAVAATGVAGTRLVAAGAGEAPETRAGAVVAAESVAAAAALELAPHAAELAVVLLVADAGLGSRTVAVETRGVPAGAGGADVVRTAALTLKCLRVAGAVAAALLLLAVDLHQPWTALVARGAVEEGVAATDTVVAGAVAAAGVRDARELHETRTALLARIAVEARVALALHLRGSDV